MTAHAAHAVPASVRDPAFLRRYGPWAVVTGASDGIGRAIAIELARRGLNLVLVARREGLLRELGRQLEDHGGIACHIAPADLATVEGRAAMIEATAGLDVGLLVAAAGFGTAGDFAGSPLAPEREMLAVNCTAVLEAVAALAPRLASRGRGGLILFSSVLAFQGVPRSAHYSATKAWVQTFGEGLRSELKPCGVDVLISAPGPVATGFARRAGLALGTALRPDVVARATLGALGRAGTIRPGWLSKLLGWSLATLPRAGRILVMGRIMRAMTAGQPVAMPRPPHAGS